jgi:hypothetical protein
MRADRLTVNCEVTKVNLCCGESIPPDYGRRLDLLSSYIEGRAKSTVTAVNTSVAPTVELRQRTSCVNGRAVINLQCKRSRN